MPLAPRRAKALLAFFFALFFGIVATGCEYIDADASGGAVSHSEIADGATSDPNASSADEDSPPTDEGEPADETQETPSKSDEADPLPAAGSALATAHTLTIKGRAPKTGYSRDQFGPAWKDVDANGCDQRNDILNRDLTDITHKPGTDGCIVLTGTLIDPFSGKTIHFERGQKTSLKVQIDHVVALSDAWQKGAQQWEAEKRLRFANDPLNLLAVDGPLNAQKGDGDAATWLPPNKAFRCQYVAQLVGVKHAYELWVTQAEQDAMVRVLSECPDEPLPTGQLPPQVNANPNLAPEPKPNTEFEPEADVADEDVYYENCTAVWEALGRPINEDEPGFGSHLDRDGDGVGCEYKPR